MAAEADAWLAALRRYFAAAALGHTAWEVFHLPLYTIWYDGTPGQSWAYSSLMPRLPLTGTGVSPLAQWIVVPLVSFRWARARQHQ